MDNIGFFELVLLGVVALVVLGPEKLPGAIRTVSLWVGRLKRSFNSIKTDIEREIGADDIRRQLRNEAIMDKFKQTKAQINDATNIVKKQAEEIRRSVELEAKAIESAANPLGSSTTPTADKLAASTTQTSAIPVSSEAAAPSETPASSFELAPAPSAPDTASGASSKSSKTA
jgi:sec-independent protein translocase protein TatB